MIGHLLDSDRVFACRLLPISHGDMTELLPGSFEVGEETVIFDSSAGE